MNRAIHRRELFSLFLLGICLWIPAILLAQTSPQESTDTPQAGQKIAFLGDSITFFGCSKPSGYVRLVEAAMAQQGRKIEVIPAGWCGDTSKNMLDRLDKDVLSKKPDWMALSCGVNDVWKAPWGPSPEDYKKNVLSMVDQAQAAGIKVILLTPTMIMEDPANDFNKKLATYIDILHSIAQEKHLLVAELNAGMQTALAKQHADAPQAKGNLLTIDGVHMNGLGDQIMAIGVLKAFGLTDAQVAEAREKWMDMPNTMEISGKAAVTMREYFHLQSLATSQNHSIEDLESDLLKKNQSALLNASTNAEPANP